VVPSTFWPDEEGASFTLKESLKPLEPFKDRTLILNGVCDRIRGDGDGHMRGIGCLLTGSNCSPATFRAGRTRRPAGPAASPLIRNQELSAKGPASRTRFGSLEFGVMVPERADTWTRMSYAGPNKPLAPIDNPYQMFSKLYGRAKDQESLQSVLDDLKQDLDTVRARVGREDRQIPGRARHARARDGAGAARR
jgi:hypothetical protein